MNNRHLSREQKRNKSRSFALGLFASHLVIHTSNFALPHSGPICGLLWPACGFCSPRTERSFALDRDRALKPDPRREQRSRGPITINIQKALLALLSSEHFQRIPGMPLGAFSPSRCEPTGGQLVRGEEADVERTPIGMRFEVGLTRIAGGRQMPVMAAWLPFPAPGPILNMQISPPPSRITVLRIRESSGKPWAHHFGGCAATQSELCFATLVTITMTVCRIWAVWIRDLPLATLSTGLVTRPG